MKHAAITAIAGFALVSCSADTTAAESGIEQFHHAYNSGQLREIYAASASDMKQSTSEADFVKFLSAVRSKMGPYKSGKTVGWHVNVGTGGRLTTLNREAVFERGKATEQFVFRGEKPGAKLVGYYINSPALVIN